MGKPYQSQDPDNLDLKLTDGEIKPNETTRTRGKRQSRLTLANVCPSIQAVGSTKPPLNSCVKHWNFCPKYNLVEPECNRISFACRSNINRYGFPKCNPVFMSVTINSGTPDEKQLNLTKACTCT